MAVPKLQSTSADSSSSSDIKQVLLSGPLLGSRERNIASDFLPWDRFEPIITPEIPSTKKGEESQRFVLLPHSHHISVLAYQTGTKIATLVPFVDDAEAQDFSDQALIESVCLTKFKRRLAERTVDDVLKMQEDRDSEDQDENPKGTLDQIIEEMVLLAGCKDGSVREFSLQSLYEAASPLSVSCGAYHVMGPYCRPRRVIQVSKGDSIMHLTAPSLRNVIHKDGILTYMTIRTKALDTSVPGSKKGAGGRMNVTVTRVVIPFYDGQSKISMVGRDKGEMKRKWLVGQFRCRVGKDKNGSFMNSSPFRLTAVAKPGVDDCSVFIVIGRANTIHIFYDHAIAHQSYSGIKLDFPIENPLTSIQVSTNNDDIACGHYYGDIKVYNGILSEVESYHKSLAKAEQHFGADIPASSRPADPQTKVITSRAHWHAHPVASLVYDTLSSPVNPTLYSGGAESVLVTWQMNQGRSKPLHFLPRVSLGSIVHVVSTDRADDRPGNGILVFSDDNSLSLFESHGKGKVWEVKGLMSGLKGVKDTLFQKTIIEVDPRAKNAKDAPLVITGMPEAPGFMYWYDPIKCSITASLEIAPFNRVSKTETEDDPMPEPCVINHAFCNSGRELITLEETATENLFVGAFHDHGKMGSYGVVTTIRFWTSAEDGDSRHPYTLAAAMSFPHGPKNRVSALAASKDGTTACTVSNDEKAFRLWKKVVPEDGDRTKRIPAWTCQYKVTLPAGFSNFVTMRDGVVFSEDGSTLALCCGNMVTLWDSAEARFLTSLRHLEGGVGRIHSVQFISCGLLKDVLLMRSEFGVSMQSPFGSRHGFKGWSWAVPAGPKVAVRISSAEFLPSNGSVAISIFDSPRCRSRLILIDALSGKVTGTAGGKLMLENIGGCIMCLSTAGQAPKISNWSKALENTETAKMQLYGLTNNGRLVLFTDIDPDNSLSARDAWKKQAISVGPTLAISEGRSAKRQREEEHASIPRVEPSSKKSALDIFGLVSNDIKKDVSPSTSELPSLSRNFVRSFVGRRLGRGSEK